MQKIYNTAIIGGGAGGLVCAVGLLKGENSLNGNEIVVLERKDRVGKKLLATGNGQGNLSNDNISPEFYHGNRTFIDSFIRSFNNINLKKYFEDLGIILSSDENGKVYPLSKQANAVLDILRAFLSIHNCQVRTDYFVNRVEKERGVFSISDGKEKIYAENVVFATGGKAGKQFGTDGSSYALLESFGHKLTSLYPSLVQLKTNTDSIRGLRGIKEYARVSAFYKGQMLKSFCGDVLFTEYGVSGNAVFQVSSAVCDKKGAYLIIEFLPDISREKLIKILIQRKKLSYLNSDDILTGIINKKIGQTIIKNLNSSDENLIAERIKNFRLDISGTMGFDYAQVTRGGIDTRDFNPLTMESKLQKGLYAIGEVLDIDGDCGGYNLTFAFTSALIASDAIKSKYQNKTF